MTDVGKGARLYGGRQKGRKAHGKGAATAGAKHAVTGTKHMVTRMVPYGREGEIKES